MSELLQQPTEDYYKSMLQKYESMVHLTPRQAEAIINDWAYKQGAIRSLKKQVQALRSTASPADSEPVPQDEKEQQKGKV